MSSARIAMRSTAAVLLASAPACGPGEPPLEQPAFVQPEAIILISLDTLRADMLGLYGFDEYPTSPFLDSLEAETVVFENAIVQAPRTLISHMSLFTGLPPEEHRVDDDKPLDPAVPTLAQRLSEHGYRTQAFADGGYLRSRWGFAQGFHRYDQGNGGGFAAVLPKAQKWLERPGRTPFFLFLHTYDVHSEGKGPFYQSPEPFQGVFSGNIDSELDGRSKTSFGKSFRTKKGVLSANDKLFVKARYAEGIRHVDWMLGTFFERLREFDWFDQALIVIWSDHGEGLYDHGESTHGELFDHTIRVPLIVRFPGGAFGGLRVRSVVQSLDLAPTLLELAGAAPLEASPGRSLLALLRAEDESRFSFSARTNTRRFSLRTDRHQYIWHERTGDRMLFDVKDDPLQRRNLTGEGVAAEPELRRRLEQWVAAHDRKRSEPRDAAPVPVDADTEAELRALGYIE